MAPDRSPDRNLSIASVSSTPIAAAAPTAPAPVQAPAASASTLPSTAQIEPASVVADAAPASPTLAHAASDPIATPAPTLGSMAPVPGAAASMPVPSPGKPTVAATAGRPHSATLASAKTGAARADFHAATLSKPRRSVDDADADLVAALIARLDRRGADPAPLPGRIRHEDGSSLAGVVRACRSKADAVEAQRCLDRACEKHAGLGGACAVSGVAGQPPDSAVGAGHPD